MTWDGVLRLRGDSLKELAARHGGRVVIGEDASPRAIASLDCAAQGDIAPLLSSRFVAMAQAALARGACLLVGKGLAKTWRVELAEGKAHSSGGRSGVWEHEQAKWALAGILDEVIVEDSLPVIGSGCSVASSAVLGPRVVLGDRVSIGPGCVIGHPGFGWAFGPGHAIRPIPQLGGVVIESDVSLGPLCTVDAGTLSCTRIRRGAKIDAQVHVGHNVEIGEGCIVAAQCGFAGSVKLGKNVMVGGQTGVADHVIVGDAARIAAKSGVIADVPSGAVVAGYPAVPRMRWLRALAKLYALSRRGM